MGAVIRQTWLIALRDRFLAALLLALLATVAASVFLAGQSLIEQRETALAFIAFMARLIVPLGLGLFGSVLVQRSFDSGDIMLQLSRPLSRPAYVVALFAGLLAIALPVIAIVLLALRAICAVPLLALGEWGMGLALESAVVIAFALFAALGLQSLTGAILPTLAFYLLARLAGVVMAIAGSGFHETTGPGDAAIKQAAGILAMILPRLDLFSAGWLSHPPARLPAFAAQVGVFTVLLLGCAGFDLKRRRF